jgi:hypothetical protein
MKITAHSESHIVELDDGTKWQVSPGDLDVTLHWKPETDLKLVRIDDDISPQALISEDDNGRGARPASGAKLALKRASHDRKDKAWSTQDRQRLMSGKPTSTAMKTQPTEWRNTPAPMGQAPSKRSKPARASRPVYSQAEAEATRQSSLKTQRSQMVKVKRHNAQRRGSD